MSFGLGYVLGEGLLGAAMGAGEGVASNADLEQKTQIEQLREQRLSQLRIQEHAANTQSDIKAKDAEAGIIAQRSAQFFQNNKLPSTRINETASATYDDPNNPGQTATADSNTVTAQAQPSDRTQAAEYARQALSTGRPEIMKAANDFQGDVLKREDQDRKNTLEQSKVGLEAQRNGYYVALADKYKAETDLLAQGGKAIPTPMIQSKQDDAGHGYLIDTHSGAIGEIVPGQAASKGDTHFFKPNDPDQPAVPMHVEWRTADGKAIQGGIDALYPGWAASRNKVLGKKADAPQAPSSTVDDGSGITAEIRAAAGGADSPAASQAKAAAKAPPASLPLPDGKGAAKFTGRYSVAGKPIYQDGSGNKFVGE